mmetsp:Transcript_2278/g.5080  ORF Transcript_2278/g.5080 Transcript_2278/m.5080 type:complete len:210 (-) Transcript_2278:219-848(-)
MFLAVPGVAVLKRRVVEQVGIVLQVFGHGRGLDGLAVAKLQHVDLTLLVTVCTNSMHLVIPPHSSVRHTVWPLIQPLPMPFSVPPLPLVHLPVFKDVRPESVPPPVCELAAVLFSAWPCVVAVSMLHVLRVRPLVRLSVGVLVGALSIEVSADPRPLVHISVSKHFDTKALGLVICKISFILGPISPSQKPLAVLPVRPELPHVLIPVG